MGIPSKVELEELATEIAGSWKKLARRLEVDDSRITAIDKENEEYDEKGYNMLLYWKQKAGTAATYQVLYCALNHKLVCRSDLADQYCLEI